ncbi:MAG: lipoate--protein ligase [Vallitaleaceae bacterium]|nr:lipoate--protein ligase [Vallitaleaceae bacterium]
MINKVQVLQSEGFNPYENLALEAYLLEHLETDTCILYLWQNQNTVVIGVNQNAWKECKVQELEADGGHLARRLSGGGAVFHDLGNLNFTFIVKEKDYSVERQLQVIIKACESLGIGAEKSGRNDILVDGKKFSGNAFYHSGENAYHHGTLLINVDMGKLSRYLNVSVDKLTSKGVNSVKSRVTNLKEYCPELTIDLMKERLIAAMEEVYGLKPEILKSQTIDTKGLQELANIYDSWDWKYGKKLAFEYNLTHRFAWGDIDLQFHMTSGKVIEVAVYSDAMEGEFIKRLPECFKGCAFSSKLLAEALNPLLQGEHSSEQTTLMVHDLQTLIRDQNF